MPAAVPPAAGDLLRGERVAFVGKLGGMPRRQAQQLVRGQGGMCLERADATATLIVVGDEGLLALGDLLQADSPLDAAAREAVDQGRIAVISETELWQRLGLVELEQNIRRLYTPGMLADLLRVPVAVIRRWHRKGLIVPARVVSRLPYFDFQEVATARCLAQLLAAGLSPHSIEKKLADLARLLPDVKRPLAQLQAIVEGKQILLRQGDGLVEPSGQKRIDFEAASAQREAEDAPADIAGQLEVGPDAATQQPNQTQSLPLGECPPVSAEELVAMAAELEDEGRLSEAVDAYRAALAAAGPSAEVNFSLAELLYRQGDLSAASERYYMAIELDEDYVEARANLGCVLAERGQTELAVAALEGALAHHGQYPDVHYHLGRLLDELGRADEAQAHWSAFLELAANSPWAEQARQRLGL